MAQAGYNEIEERVHDLPERMAQRTLVLWTFIISGVLVAFELVHFYWDIDWNPKVVNPSYNWNFAFVLALGDQFCRQLLRVLNGYYPSSLLPLGLFAVVQQGIYGVSAGFKVVFLDRIHLVTLLYGMFFAGYILLGAGSFYPLQVVFTVATAAYGANIWCSLRTDVKNAQREWLKFSGRFFS